MKVPLIGSLLCAGMLILATSSGSYAAEDKARKETKAGAAVTTSLSNVKSPPECAQAGGRWDPAKKSCSK